MPVLCISEKHPQNFICIVLKFHKTPHSEDNCKSMLSIIDDSSTAAFLKNMKELSTPNSQLHIETSLTGSDSTVTTVISITVPSPSHTCQMDSSLCFFLILEDFTAALGVSFVCLSSKGGYSVSAECC